MNRRQKKLILLLLNETDYKRAKYYADALGYSERTIYSDLQEIEHIVQSMGFKLDRKPGVGTKLIVDRQDRLNILSRVNMKPETFDPYSTEERQKRIALRLLHQNHPLSMQKFAEEYFVSKTAIAKDMDKIGQNLLNYHLKLVRNHQGVYVEGLERNRRQAIAAFIATILDLQQTQPLSKKRDRLDTTTKQRLSEFFSTEMVAGVLQLINDIERENNLAINDLYYQNVVTHMLILIKRVMQDRHADFSFLEQQSVEPKVENIAGQLIRNIHRIFNYSITAAEAKYLALYLFHCSERNRYLTSEVELNSLTIHQTIREMIDAFSKVMEIDLREDTELQNGLKLHIEPMLQRLKIGLNLNNPMLMAIKSRYHSIFGMTWLISIFIENQFHVQLNEDEVGFITLHFLAAIERRIYDQPKRVVIVCYDGIGTSQFLANRMKNRIPEIQVVDVIPLTQLGKIDLREIDFIITTVPMESEQKPIVTVSPILDEQDIVKINQTIFGLKNKPNERRSIDTQAPSILSQMLDPDLIFAQEKTRNKREILHFICEALHTRAFVDPDYEDSVFEREARAPTSVGNGIAIPHGTETYIHKPHLVIYTSKHPVDWGSEDVSLIFLIAVKTTGSIDFRLALRELYRIFENTDLLQALKKAQDPHHIYQLIHHSTG
ncbi:transcriptional antiterminator [Kroppenstedtia sanguinis]|uniref:BglG family transcription antiterminator n=1 Tax=Kroppenstedtia sanguinis TaxID=1380684 RepID=A0ABW4CA66_9BACL